MDEGRKSGSRERRGVGGKLALGGPAARSSRAWWREPAVYTARTRPRIRPPPPLGRDPPESTPEASRAPSSSHTVERRDAGGRIGKRSTQFTARMIGAGERAEQLGREGDQDTTHKMSLTKNPTNPMTMNPRPVRSATLLNSLRSGLVHLFRSRMESLAKSRTGLTAMSATSMLFCYHSCVFDSGVDVS